MNFFSVKNVVVFIVLAVVVFTALIFLGDYSKVIESLGTVKMEIIAAIMVLALANYVFRYFKWEYFLRVLKIRLPFRTSFLVFLSGLSMAITPGKVGEIIKSYYLKKIEGIEVSRTVMIVFSERLTDVLGLSVLSLLGLASFFEQAYFLVGLLIAIFAGIFVLTNERIFMKFCDLSCRIPFVKKYTNQLRSLYTSCRVLLSFKSLAVTTSISIVSWFFECFALYLLLNSLGVPLSLLSATFIFSFSSIFGSVLVLPGGLGAAEGSFVVLLLFVGVSLTMASLSTIVIRVFTLFFGVLIGVVALMLANRIKS